MQSETALPTAGSWLATLFPASHCFMFSLYTTVMSTEVQYLMSWMSHPQVGLAFWVVHTRAKHIDLTSWILHPQIKHICNNSDLSCCHGRGHHGNYFSFSIYYLNISNCYNLTITPTDFSDPNSHEPHGQRKGSMGGRKQKWVLVGSRESRRHSAVQVGNARSFGHCLSSDFTTYVLQFSKHLDGWHWAWWNRDCSHRDFPLHTDHPPCTKDNDHCGSHPWNIAHCCLEQN